MAPDEKKLHMSLSLVFLSMCEMSGIRDGKKNDLSLVSISIIRGCMMEKLTIGDIARMNRISYGTATKCVTVLENKGFVKREKSDMDGRVVYVLPAEKAYRWVEAMEAKMHDYVNAGNSRLSLEERETFTDLLARFTGYSDDQPYGDLLVTALKDSDRGS